MTIVCDEGGEFEKRFFRFKKKFPFSKMSIVSNILVII